VKAKVKKGYNPGEKDQKNGEHTAEITRAASWQWRKKKGSDKGHKCKMKSNAQGVNVSRGRHGLTLMGPWMGRWAWQCVARWVKVFKTR